MTIQEVLNQEPLTIIDVREPYEFLSNKIFGALNMPMSEFADYIDQLKEMEGYKVFYCRSGNRSAQVVAYLKSIGVENVYNGGALSMLESCYVPTK